MTAVQLGFSLLKLFQSAQQAVRAECMHALSREEGIRRVEGKQGSHSLMRVGWSVRSAVMRVCRLCQGKASSRRRAAAAIWRASERWRLRGAATATHIRAATPQGPA